MTDITINLKDIITIGFLLVTAIGLWFKIRKLRLNDLDGIKKCIKGLSKDFGDYKDARNEKDIAIEGRLSGLETHVGELRRDIDRVNKN